MNVTRKSGNLNLRVGIRNGSWADQQSLLGFNLSVCVVGNSKKEKDYCSKNNMQSSFFPLVPNIRNHEQLGLPVLEPAC